VDDEGENGIEHRQGGMENGGILALDCVPLVNWAEETDPGEPSSPPLGAGVGWL
jgi:hypothetical protein